MKHSAIWVTAGWAIAFGALIGCTLLFTGLVFEAAVEQQNINEIIRSTYLNSVYPEGK